MVYSILPVPFASAARQRQYEALHAALATDAAAPTVLLGNLAAFTPIEADALVVRPGGVALLVLTPRGGRLSIPALAYGTWQLDGQPLPGREEADNPFAQYQQQLPAALGWLGEQLAWAQPPAQAGLALFEAPLTFGPEVETHLHHHASAHAFQLVGNVAQVSARLHQALDVQLDALTEDDLLDWADYLAAGLPAAGEPTPDWSPAHYLGQKLRQLWSWLGAEDIPADPPYGSAAPLPDSAQRDQQEQARLHQLRQELLAELRQQRQEAAAREATRTQELAQLRQQLAQAGQSAAERQAEQEAKAALENSLRTARTELATRNQELDARIRQLGQLIEQLHQPRPSGATVPEKLTSAPPRAATPPTTRVVPPRPRYRRLYQAERWGLVALGLSIIGAGGWGVARWLHPHKSQAVTTTRTHLPQADEPEETQAPAPVIIYDSVARTPLLVEDTAVVRAAPAAEHTASRAAESAPERVDSTTSDTERPTPMPADSAEASPTP